MLWNGLIDLSNLCITLHTYLFEVRALEMYAFSNFQVFHILQLTKSPCYIIDA
jgi:hypothetical protein